ncbi:MAG: hypothetical protein ABW252_18390 [Polyangiales bacterium]
MEYPDIEYLQRLVEHLMKELEASVESFSRLNRRLRSLENVRKPPASEEHALEPRV